MPIDPAIPDRTEPQARLAAKLSSLERRVAVLERFMQGGTLGQIAVVAALPPAGRQGRFVMLASDSTIWKDTGVAWALA